ncbi:hypothetical protein ACIQ9K_37785 [Streptomyces microflavus]|uniref:hypothetical protein n=1 Tax=Streptomyces microflavus TaxID=1919 RepID=UPI00382D3EE3
MFLLAAREEAANTTPPMHELPLDSDDAQMVLRITWHDALQPDVIVEPGDDWKKNAPSLLQRLAAACDGVDLEGPPDIAQVAHSIVTKTHRLLAGMPLFEIEEGYHKEIYEEGQSASPSAWDLLRSDVSDYFDELQHFRREAERLLDKSGSSRSPQGRLRQVSQLNTMMSVAMDNSDQEISFVSTGTAGFGRTSDY